MISSLLNYLALFIAFKTPYPYYLGLCVAFGLLLFFIMFVKLKNGWISYLALLVSLAILVGGVKTINDKFYPDEDKLDNTTATIVSISGRGLTLDTGDTITPVGVEFYSWPGRKYKLMKNEIESVINNKPVKLEYSELYKGYDVITSDGVNLAEHLISNGYVKIAREANDRLRKLEYDAAENRKGVWGGLDPDEGNPHPAMSALSVFAGELFPLLFIWLIVFVLSLISLEIVIPFPAACKPKPSSDKDVGPRTLEAMEELASRIAMDKH